MGLKKMIKNAQAKVQEKRNQNQTARKSKRNWGDERKAKKERRFEKREARRERKAQLKRDKIAMKEKKHQLKFGGGGQSTWGNILSGLGDVAGRVFGDSKNGGLLFGTEDGMLEREDGTLINPSANQRLYISPDANSELRAMNKEIINEESNMFDKIKMWLMNVWNFLTNWKRQAEQTDMQYYMWIGKKVATIILVLLGIVVLLVKVFKVRINWLPNYKIFRP